MGKPKIESVTSNEEQEESQGRLKADRGARDDQEEEVKDLVGSSGRSREEDEPGWTQREQTMAKAITRIAHRKGYHFSSLEHKLDHCWQATRRRRRQQQG